MYTIEEIQLIYNSVYNHEIGNVAQHLLPEIPYNPKWLTDSDERVKRTILAAQEEAAIMKKNLEEIGIMESIKKDREKMASNMVEAMTKPVENKFSSNKQMGYTVIGILGVVTSVTTIALVILGYVMFFE